MVSQLDPGTLLLRRCLPAIRHTVRTCGDCDIQNNVYLGEPPHAVLWFILLLHETHDSCRVETASTRFSPH